MKRILLFFQLSALSLFGLAQTSLNYIFEPGMGDYQCFRIPAIVKANDGTLLAFAEARKNSCSDTGDIDLVMRSSNDNGTSWGDIQIIWDDADNVCGNPAPVVDQETGRISLLLTWNLGTDAEHEIIDGKSEDTRRVYLLHSEDNGYSWTSPNEITKDVKEDSWTWYATGPVHGIQMSKRSEYPGRLVIPCDHIESGTKKYYSHSIHSDDGGLSWQLGGTTPQDQVNECTVAERSDGSLMLNMRNYDRSMKTRKVSISSDGGSTWSDLKSNDQLIEPICQAALISQSNMMVFSNPASEDKREKMTIKISQDNGKSWPNAFEAYNGPSAYSDLVWIDDTTIGLLFEGGVKSPYEGITFHTYNLKDLTND